MMSYRNEIVTLVELTVQDTTTVGQRVTGTGSEGDIVPRTWYFPLLMDRERNWWKRCFLSGLLMSVT